MTFFIPPEKITEIQSAIDIFDVVSDYVPLNQKGKNFIGLCPFHQEKTPSFSVSVEKQIYKCFGCGEGGTVFNFLMKLEGLSFGEAVETLAKKTNIRIDKFHAKEKNSGNDVLYETNKYAVNFFSEMLRNTDSGKQSVNYLSDRSINDGSIIKFKLGYSPNRWDSLVNKSTGWGLSTQTFEKAGLVIKKDAGRFYDRFRNRLMFPIFDLQNRPLGFGARTLDGTLPKYLNSPETPIFDKSKILYGINLAKTAIMKTRKVLIMEGYTDVIMAHQCGIDWSIAVLGTALTREHVRLLKRYCDKAILVFDADSAGQKSSERNLDIFIMEDLDVGVVLLPESYDPYDFLVKRGAQKFLEQVDNAYDFFSFKIKLLGEKWDLSSVSGKASAIDEVLATAIKVPNILKRELTIKRISEEMSLDESLLRSHLARFKSLKKDQTAKRDLHNKMNEAINKKDSANLKVEKTVLGIIINRNDLIEKAESDIGLSNFSDSNLRDIAERIFHVYSQKRKVELSDIFPVLSDTKKGGDLVDIVSQQANMSGPSTTGQTQDSEDVLNECIRFIRRKKSRDGLKLTKKKMLALEKTKNSVQEVDELLSKFHEKSMDFHSLGKFEK